MYFIETCECAHCLKTEAHILDSANQHHQTCC